MNYKVLNREKILKNLEYYRSFGKNLVIMLKANAYGHGMEEIAKILQKENVKIGVATIEEGENVAKFFDGKILIVEPVRDLGRLKDNFEFVVEDIETLKQVKKKNLLSSCYLKINTGMNRFGFCYDNKKSLKKAKKIIEKEEFKGLFTHFSFLEDKEFSCLQYDRFCKVKSLFGDNVKSCFGGSGAIRFLADEYRVGIGFYGYEDDNVQPILTIKGEILKVFTLNKGDVLGYNNKFVAEREMRVGVVSLGYGDGIRRDLSGFYCLFNGEKCPIIANICMDCLFVDLTGKVANKGDFVVMERADLIAKELGTISYEVLTGYSSLRGKTLVQ